MGDVVMIKDSNVIRRQWRLALVAKTHPGSDVKVRKGVFTYYVSSSRGERGFRQELMLFKIR